MTLNEIMARPDLTEAGKIQEILNIDGHGGKYAVWCPSDINWSQNCKWFRSLRTARAYAMLANTSLSSLNEMEVLGPDGTWHEAGWEIEVSA